MTDTSYARRRRMRAERTARGERPGVREGRPTTPQREPRLRLVLALLMVLGNTASAVAIYVIAAIVVPMPRLAHGDEVRTQNLIGAACFFLLAVVAGLMRGGVLTRKIARWLHDDRAPDEAEQRAVISAPSRMVFLHAVIWGTAAVSFGIFNALHDPLVGVLVAVIVVQAGLVACGYAYLVTERMLRPLARVALQSGVPDRIGMRMGVRTFLAWMLGSGVLVFGIALTGVTVLVADTEATVHRLAVTMIVLGALAAYVGGLFVLMAARAASDPVRALREAVGKVRSGDLDARVPIYDGTELGILQAGFNDMVGGLQEREEIRDLFGRHVGDDVARAALDSGVELGGEVRTVGVLFVDIVGSTTLAQEKPPEEVVAELNRFFDVVIEVVHEHGGWVNKFEGDAALAVWGAPQPCEGMEAAVLRAARELGRRLLDAVPGLRAGIGVSAGAAVAGNVGAATRYEYTVIGDPVNEAARLTELAKEYDGLVLANACLLDDAGAEADRWERRDPVRLRGRGQPTEVAVPAK